jgi:hypothetical protein
VRFSGRSRARRILVLALIVIAIGGMLFGGAVHCALHDHESNDCVACRWVGLDVATPPPPLETPDFLELACDPRPDAHPQSTPRVRLTPRAPPVVG